MFKTVLLAALFALVICPAKAYGDTKAQLARKLADITWKSWFSPGDNPPWDEYDKSEAAWLDYFLQQTPQVAGGVAKNGIFGVSYQLGEIGSQETLTFSWLNSSTLQPTLGPAIASVRYEIMDGPESYPNMATDRPWLLLGTSVNSLSDFALDFTISSFEPIIRGIPLDALGNEISMLGPDGENRAYGFAIDIVPEPSTMALVGMGLAGLVMKASRRRNK